jgi:hypothetical protein
MKVKSGSGSDGATAAMHHFGFKLGLEGLDLAKHGEATGGAAHLVLKLIEDLMQTLGSGPEGWVVLPCCGVHVHGGSVTSWTT